MDGADMTDIYAGFGESHWPQWEPQYPMEFCADPLAALSKLSVNGKVAWSQVQTLDPVEIATVKFASPEEATAFAREANSWAHAYADWRDETVTLRPRQARRLAREFRKGMAAATAVG